MNVSLCPGIGHVSLDEGEALRVGGPAQTGKTSTGVTVRSREMETAGDPLFFEEPPQDLLRHLLSLPPRLP